MTSEGELLKAARAQLTYDPATGEIRRRSRPDRIAGGLDSKGHRQIRLNGKLYFAHRLAWLISHEKWPDGVIDHINHRRDDNRLANLRDCTMADNSKNMLRYRNNTSGVTGVFQVRRSGKFVAYIHVGGKRITLGTHATFEEAADARKTAERRYAFTGGEAGPVWTLTAAGKIDAP